jgi:hypothetical protein
VTALQCQWQSPQLVLYSLPLAIIEFESESAESELEVELRVRFQIASHGATGSLSEVRVGGESIEEFTQPHSGWQAEAHSSSESTGTILVIHYQWQHSTGSSSVHWQLLVVVPLLVHLVLSS